MFENKYIINFNEPLIEFDVWEAIIREARRREDTYKFGLNYRCQVKYYDFAIKLKEKIPTLRDHFFILNTNRLAREFPPHIQGKPGSGGAASINWPILNCEDHSPSTWYRCKTEPIFANDLYKDSFLVANVEDLEPIHTEAMLSSTRKPCLFRSDVIHKGFNNMPKGETRTIVKWEMEEGSWEEASQFLYKEGYIDV